MLDQRHSWNHRISRRSLLGLAGTTGLAASLGGPLVSENLHWLTYLASRVARQERDDKRSTAQSLILLWLDGGPSQLETFDPHPDSKIAYGSRARKTNVPEIMLGDGLEQLAEVMDSVALVRSFTSREGDHQRAIYNVKTSFRPDPTLIHPAIGSVICHQLNRATDQIDIPRHVSMLTTQYPARGGYLGSQYDAFQVEDPSQKVPDVYATVSPDRQRKRLDALNYLDHRFIQGQLAERIELAPDSLKNQNIGAALKMMSSDQLSAFDLTDVPAAEKIKFGDTPFGRGCLAALRLISAGVRCVEVTLPGWDTHVNNHELQGRLIRQLDAALAHLIRELKQRDLLDSTMVVCGGEFGRTPVMNPLGGRDHWSHGFSFALAGGGIQGGRVVGETTPDLSQIEQHPQRGVLDPQPIENLHATILQAFGVHFTKELDTPIGRPIKICEGKPIDALLAH